MDEFNSILYVKWILAADAFALFFSSCMLEYYLSLKIVYSILFAFISAFFFKENFMFKTVWKTCLYNEFFVNVTKLIYHKMQYYGGNHRYFHTKKSNSSLYLLMNTYLCVINEMEPINLLLNILKAYYSNYFRTYKIIFFK